MWYSVAGVFPLEHIMSQYQDLAPFVAAQYSVLWACHTVHPLITGWTLRRLRFCPLVSAGAVYGHALVSVDTCSALLGEYL